MYAKMMRIHHNNHPSSHYPVSIASQQSSSFRHRHHYLSHHNQNHHHADDSIEVSIMPSDDPWADNTTAITGNTSERSVSIDVDLNKLGKPGYNLSVTNSFRNSSAHNNLNNSDCSTKNLWNSSSWSTKCSIWCGPFTLGLLSLCAFISPLVMVILPQIETLEWKVKECGPECDGTLISCLFKLALLSILSYITFFSSPRSSFPRIDVYRALLMTLLTLLMVAYWVFYIEKIWDRRFSDYELTYQSIVQFSVSMLDLLLWIYFAAVVMLKIKPNEAVFIVKVTRSPDGEARSYTLGELSIQRAAIVVLENYYTDFTIYNPYLELAPPRVRGKSHRGYNSLGPRSTLKFYDIDGISSNANGIIGNGGITGEHQVTGNASVVGAPMGPNGNTIGLPGSLILGSHQKSSTLQSSNRNGNEAERFDEINNLEERGSRVGGRSARHVRDNSSSHHHHHHHHHSQNERFYEEHEYERRVRKRKARLLSATEDAFTHIKRVRADEPCPVSSPIDPKEASQAIFPAMARSLQKFLRVTRQQPRHTVESIVDHLATCLTYDLSPKAFLETFFNPRPVISCSTECKAIQTWGLVSEVLLTRTIESGTVFMLRQNDVSLLVTVTSIPHLNITEEIIDPKCNKFVFKMNSETSV